MRLLLLIALLLYNIIINDSREINYDYADPDGAKRHSSIDDRRNWRKRILMKSSDHERDWDDRRYERERPKYVDESSRSMGMIDRQRELELSQMAYNGRRHYDERDKLNVPRTKSAEVFHDNIAEKKEEKKIHYSMSCVKPHERYEACFAGCAAITCDNPRERLQPCYPFCEAGCICVHPYVRDDRTHKCVLPDDCTKGLKGIPDLTEDT